MSNYRRIDLPNHNNAETILFIGFSIHKYILLDTKIKFLCQLEAGIWLKMIFSTPGSHFELRP